VHKTLSGVGGSYALDVAGASGAIRTPTLSTIVDGWANFYATPQSPGAPLVMDFVFLIGGTGTFGVRVRVDGFIELYRTATGITGSPVATSATAINRGVGHWFSIRLSALTSAGTATVKVDGVQIVTYGGNTRGHATLSDWNQITFAQAVLTSTQDHTIDDLIIDDTNEVTEKFCQVMSPDSLVYGNFTGVSVDGGVQATGTITTIAGASIVDTETFTISDGFGGVTGDPGVGAKIFEFDSGGGVSGGNVAVAFTGGDSADTIRDSIIAAINGVANFRVTASSGGAATVSLVNDFDGTFGNLTITETVANAGFIVSGMSGGVNGNRDDNIDEVPTSDADYNTAAAINDEEVYGLSNPANAPSSVHTAVFNAEAARSGAITQGEIIVQSGTTQVYGTVKVLPASGFELWEAIHDVDPNTAAAWTSSGLNGAKAGLRFT
jgi:hypothetical protein